MVRVIPLAGRPMGARNCIGIGILIKYDKLMKKADILHEGELLEIRAHLVEKVGKKDGFDNGKRSH